MTLHGSQQFQAEGAHLIVREFWEDRCSVKCVLHFVGERIGLRCWLLYVACWDRRLLFLETQMQGFGLGLLTESCLVSLIALGGGDTLGLQTGRLGCDCSCGWT